MTPQHHTQPVANCPGRHRKPIVKRQIDDSSGTWRVAVTIFPSGRHRVGSVPCLLATGGEPALPSVDLRDIRPGSRDLRRGPTFTTNTAQHSRYIGQADRPVSRSVQRCEGRGLPVLLLTIRFRKFRLPAFTASFQASLKSARKGFSLNKSGAHSIALRPTRELGQEADRPGELEPRLRQIAHGLSERGKRLVCCEGLLGDVGHIHEPTQALACLNASQRQPAARSIAI